MAALVKYADSDNTKDPNLEEDKPGKGRRTSTPRDNSITRQVMGIMVSARQIVQILWLTLICSVVKVNRPSAVEE